MDYNKNPQWLLSQEHQQQMISTKEKQALRFHLISTWVWLHIQSLRPLVKQMIKHKICNKKESNKILDNKRLSNCKILWWMKAHLVKAVCPLYQMSLKMTQSIRDRHLKQRVLKMTWHNQVQDKTIGKRLNDTTNPVQYYR